MMIKYIEKDVTTTITTLGLWRVVCREHGIPCTQAGNKDDELNKSIVLSDLRGWLGWCNSENGILIYSDMIRNGIVRT